MFKNILHTFGTRALAAVINLLIAILLTQFLGPAGKGQQGLIITTITFILVFSNLVGGATLVFLAPRRDHSQLLLPSYSWTILMSIVALPVLYIFDLVEEPFILHVCILAAINSFSAIHISLLIGKERITSANFISLLQPVTTIVFLLFFFILLDLRSVWSYVLSLYASFSMSFIISYFYLVKYIGGVIFSSFRGFFRLMGEMFRYGFLNQAAHITQMMSFRLSFYVLNSYHGESAVGIYSTGISLAESVWLIAKSISMVQYARISNTEDRNYSQKLTIQLSKVSLLLSLVFLIPLLAFPSSVYTFIFGGGFADVRVVIWSLAAGVVIYNFSILLGHYFSGTGRYHVNALVSTAGLLVSITLFYLLIPEYSLAGAGIATSASYLFTTLVLLVIFIKDDPGNFMNSLSFRGDMSALKKEIRDLFRA